MTIFEAYNKTKKELDSAGIEDYVFEAKQIIKHITGLSNAEILMNANKALTIFQENNLTAIIKQRLIRYPLQYIIGQWSFYGLEFKVGPGVLVPRADTELLVDTALEFLKKKPNAKVLDLCTGSGCVAIAIEKNADCEVCGVEKYGEALRYAKQNVALNNTHNLRLIQGDIFEKAGMDRSYDLIVCNPPYIPPYELGEMSPETKFEPETALFGGEDGLDFYRAVIDNYKDCLIPSGMLAFEVGFSGAAAVSLLMQKANFKNIGTKADAAGIQRVVFGTL